MYFNRIVSIEILNLYKAPVFVLKTSQNDARVAGGERFLYTAFFKIS